MTKWHRSLVLAAGMVAAALLLAPVASGVGVGHSGWEWSSPLPQGNTIRSLDFVAGRGYAAGDFGTLLRTDDGGLTWSGLRTGVVEDLRLVRIIGADSLVIAGGCAVSRSDDGGATFRALPWTATRSRCLSPVASLAFPASDVGYLVLEDGSFYRSGDGGQSWNRITDLPATALSGGEAIATDLFFPESDAGFASTTDGIYRTGDGGVSWTRVAARSGGFNGLTFAGPLTGFAVGSDSAIFETTDGGLTWSPETVNVGGPFTFDSVRCVSVIRCLVTTSVGDRIIRTVNGGGNWTSAPLLGGSGLAAAFTSATRAVAAGQGGAISISGDGGASWSGVGRTLGGSFSRLRGASGFLAFAIGAHGAIARTTDAGLTWSYLTAPSAEDLVDVSFPNETTGFALDAAGSLFRTGDGGASWKPVATGTESQPQAVLALGDDRVLLMGPRGIRRSLDGALSFRVVRRRAIRKAALFDVDFAGGSLFAFGPTSLFASRDGGRTWKKLHRPDHRPLAVVDFVDSRFGFALGKGGRVWRTRDRGRSWRELLASGTDGGMDLAFSNAREGYVAANDLFFAKGSDRPDYLLRTSDGGESWRPQLVTSSRNINGLLATRDYTDFLLAGEDQLFATTTGGDGGLGSTLTLRTRRRRLTRPGRVVVTGRLEPANGGEQLVVSTTNADPRFRRGGTDWSFKSVRAHSDGSFKTRWEVRRTSVFVAQWTGDDERMGAGSRVLKVRVRGR
jgi:photosystem II stability/assembly factor-like uncharacterized protein